MRLLSNSEVGERKFVLTTFLYNGVCGNHIIWGAQSVERVAVRHIGQKAESRAFEALHIELSHYRDQSALETEAKIRTARVYQLGETKESVVNSLFAKGIATKSVLLSAYDMAERHPEDGGQVSPASAWGMVQGMTRLSQQSKFMDERGELDLAAGKILQMESGQNSSLWASLL